MAKQIETRLKREAHAIIARQILGLLLLSVLVLSIAGQRAGLSVLVGGMVYSLPDLIFVQRFIRYTGNKAVTEFISRFFAGKMMKLILRGVLIVIATMKLPVDALWVMVGFASCTLLFWAACMMHFSKQRGAV